MAGDEAGRVGGAVAAEEAGVGDEAVPSLACGGGADEVDWRVDPLEDEAEDAVVDHVHDLIDLRV